MRSSDKQMKSVVLVGKLNPSIFQPTWFAGQQLIGEQDGQEAEINIIHPDIVNFRLNWCNIEITRERFIVTTTQEQAFELIRDLAIGTFRLLAHTPINMLGINTEMHFHMKNADAWHDIGHKLAPKDLFWDDTLKNPGTLAVVIQSERPDDYNGKIQVDVKPSNKVQYGVSFRVNDHYQTESKEIAIGSNYITDILESDWENAEKRANTIINNVIRKAAI